MRKSLHVTLWVVQVLLGALFLFAGGVKLVTPIAAMAAQMPVHLPGAFLRFIGWAEALGGLGLVLPGLTGIQPRLTPLAALGLVIIMIGATAITVLAGAVGPALFPATVGALAGTVAYGRGIRRPHRTRAERRAARRPASRPAAADPQPAA